MKKLLAVLSALVIVPVSGCHTGISAENSHGDKISIRTPVWLWTSINQTLASANVRVSTNSMYISMRGLQQDVEVSTNANELVRSASEGFGYGIAKGAGLPGLPGLPTAK